MKGENNRRRVKIIINVKGGSIEKLKFFQAINNSKP